MRRPILALFMIFFANLASAKSLGTFGATFPVAEQSLLQLIEKRLASITLSGELKELEKQWLIEATRKADRPSPLALTRTNKSFTHFYKPELILGQNIVDARGRILYLAGTKVNALEQLPTYQPCWMFFNADDKVQFNWAAKFLQTPACPNPTIILTGGSVYQTEKALNSVIYFDQAARISTKLNINAVPALVTRDANSLRINELALTEDGDVI